MSNELKQALEEFVRFSRSLKDDEKSEAQSFLDHFFRALGHEGVIEAGANFEFRFAKKPGSPQLELVVAGIGDPGHRPKGGKKFADLLWPDRVLIEMKSRGTKLEKYRAFDYWSPHRSEAASLCHPLQLRRVLDLRFQHSALRSGRSRPVGDLPTSISAFNFLLPPAKPPIFENNRVEVARRAADLMARVFREIIFRGEKRERAQRFLVQLLVAVVAEDGGLLRAYISLPCSPALHFAVGK